MKVGGRIPASRMRAQSDGRRGLVDVDEGDPRTLRAKVLDDRSPDPRAAAGDEYPLVGEAWILRELRRSCIPFVLVRMSPIL